MCVESPLPQWNVVWVHFSYCGGVTQTHVCSHPNRAFVIPRAELAVTYPAQPRPHVIDRGSQSRYLPSPVLSIYVTPRSRVIKAGVDGSPPERCLGAGLKPTFSATSQVISGVESKWMRPPNGPQAACVVLFGSRREFPLSGCLSICALMTRNAGLGMSVSQTGWRCGAAHSFPSWNDTRDTPLAGSRLYIARHPPIGLAPPPPHVAQLCI